jgi:2-isopropylmalate synthase
MEEIVMALKVRQQALDGLHTNINPSAFYEASQMVSSMTSIPVQPNKAIVGRNAFAHESGIHQDGFLKERNTYEIMEPEMLGIPAVALPLGPRSGRAALRMRLNALGIELSPEELTNIFSLFKAVADEKKQVTDTDLQVIHQQFKASQVVTV